MLQREIRKLREEFEVPKPYPRVKLPGEHYLPGDYIPDEEHRIRQYQELAACRNLEEVDNLKNHWLETFGELPEPARDVIRRHKLKILADNLDWEDFRYRNDRLNVRFREEPPQLLIDSARKVNAMPTVRSDRLLVDRLPKSKISRWLELVTEQRKDLQPVSV